MKIERECVCENESEREKIERESEHRERESEHCESEH